MNKLGKWNRSSSSVLFLSVMSFWCGILQAGEGPLELVTDFSTDVPTNDRQSVFALRLEKVRPLHGEFAGSIDVYLKRDAGEWSKAGHEVTADYDSGAPSNSVIAEDLRLDDKSVSGRLAVNIRNDKANPDTLVVEFSGKIRDGVWSPWFADTEASLPPWRRDTRRFGGVRIEGTYRCVFTGGKIKGRETTGTVSGAMNYSCGPNRFGAVGNAVLLPAKDGGLNVMARLSPGRVAPPESAYAELRFDKPRDWRAYDGLRIIVLSPKRRDDAAVTVGIKEGSGAVNMTERKTDEGVWYSVTSGALLRPEATVFDVPFSDFRGDGDDNHALDVDAIVALRIGVDDPRGVGDVEFTVKRVELYRNGRRFGMPPDEPVQISLATDRLLSFNGVTNVPVGLFGVHSAGADVWYMRHGPVQPDAEEYLVQINPGMFRAAHGYPADKYIAVASKLGPPLRVIACDHLWTWGRPPFMDGNLDGIVAGFRNSYDQKALDGRYAEKHPDERPAYEVSNESFMWARSVNSGHRLREGQPDFTDPTQHGYLPGKRLAETYTRIFLSAWEGANGGGVKRMRLAAPSCVSFNNEDYDHFRSYVAPIIDRCFDKIDFLTEHHYGGCPETYGASWEVAKTYCVVKHGRALPICNTETTEMDALDSKPAHYNLADILTCLRVCPDVSYGRTVHALWAKYMGRGGEAAALVLLARLRGRMLPVTTTDAAVQAAASLTDAGEVVLVLFNTTPFTREVVIPAPVGYTLSERLRLRLGKAAVLKMEDVARNIDLYPVVDPQDCRLEEVTIVESDRTAKRIVKAQIPAGTALRWIWKPDATTKAPVKLLRVEQGYWEHQFAVVRPEKEVVGNVVWRGASSSGVRCFLRVITRDVHRGEGVAVVNGHEVELPWSSSNDGWSVAQDIPLDPGWVTTKTQIAFRCRNPGGANGFAVYAASVLVENEKE